MTSKFLPLAPTMPTPIGKRIGFNSSIIFAHSSFPSRKKIVARSLLKLPGFRHQASKIQKILLCVKFFLFLGYLPFFSMFDDSNDVATIFGF